MRARLKIRVLMHDNNFNLNAVEHLCSTAYGASDALHITLVNGQEIEFKYQDVLGFTVIAVEV